MHAIYILGTGFGGPGDGSGIWWSWGCVKNCEKLLNLVNNCLLFIIIQFCLVVVLVILGVGAGGRGAGGDGSLGRMVLLLLEMVLVVLEVGSRSPEDGPDVPWIVLVVLGAVLESGRPGYGSGIWRLLPLLFLLLILPSSSLPLPGGGG